MSQSGQSQERRAANEVMFQNQNQRIEAAANALLDPMSREALPIKFVCECSKADCVEKVEITLNEFRRVRKSSLQFIILRGHEQLDIERVVRSDSDDYLVVEKFETPPPTPEAADPRID